MNNTQSIWDELYEGADPVLLELIARLDTEDASSVITAAMKVGYTADDLGIIIERSWFDENGVLQGICSGVDNGM